MIDIKYWWRVSKMYNQGMVFFRHDPNMVSFSHISKWAEWQDIESYWIDGVFQPLANDSVSNRREGD